MHALLPHLLRSMEDETAGSGNAAASVGFLEIYCPFLHYTAVFTCIAETIGKKKKIVGEARDHAVLHVVRRDEGASDEL